MSASFQPICRPLGFSKTRDNGQLNIYDTCWLLQTVPAFADFAGVLEIIRLNTSKFLYLPG